MPLRCRNCGWWNFRASRFRRADVYRLLLLQYPVRCRHCYERDYAFLLNLFKLKGEESLHRDTPRAG